MLPLALLHFAFIGSAALNAASMVVEIPGLPQATEPGEVAGRLMAYVLIASVSLVGAVWAPVNAYGLLAKRRWARKSTIGYWIFSGIFCACIPGAAYGIWSLTREQVKVDFN